MWWAVVVVWLVGAVPSALVGVYAAEGAFGVRRGAVYFAGVVAGLLWPATWVLLAVVLFWMSYSREEK